MFHGCTRHWGWVCSGALYSSTSLNHVSHACVLDCYAALAVWLASPDAGHDVYTVTPDCTVSLTLD